MTIVEFVRAESSFGRVRWVLGELVTLLELIVEGPRIVNQSL